MMIRTLRRLATVFAVSAASLALLFAGQTAAHAAAITPPHGTVGVPYSFTDLGTVNPGATCFIDPTTLPPGLTFNATTHEISGTPTAAGTFSNIQMLCSDVTVATFDLVIDPAAESPLVNVPVALTLLAGGLCLLAVGAAYRRSRAAART